MKQHLRAIPSVEKLLQALDPIDLPRPTVVDTIRKELAAIRKEKKMLDFRSVVDRVKLLLDGLVRARIQPLINGTGIIVHTNLGRAPLGPHVMKELSKIGSSYSNLEIDLTEGKRGGRAAYLERNLALLCRSKAATVVNNCAAALILILRHFTAGKRTKVIISRGELIQIGGGFRIPEILESSGATLCEIGTTNKTRLTDYKRAIDGKTALILKVHRSNFFMDGFVASPDTEAISALAREKRIPFAEDLGSGAVIDTETFVGLEHEPTPAEELKRGVNLVCFSADKLLGGPQAGVIAGEAKHIEALKREPFFRALRCDKLILSALQATVDLHLGGALSNSIPVLGMLSVSNDELKARGESIVGALGRLSLKAKLGLGEAQIGGGALPRTIIPSTTVELSSRDIAPNEFAARLRSGSPPVVGTIANGRYKLNLRTVFPHQDEQLIRAIRATF
jgi:L-seryl-tRNA(Ser) seleniumtransferase